MAENESVREADYLLHKSVECPCCGNMVQTLQLKTGKTRRLDPDLDLRPRAKELDTIKYGVTSCNKCGYTALKNNFELITGAQRKLLKEGLCKTFRSIDMPPVDTYTYQMAIDYHKLALVNTMEKRGRASEKAYTCLLIAWLDRGAREERQKMQEEEASDSNLLAIGVLKKEEHKFLEQAYEGFSEAIAKETPPFCGLDLNTVEYLIAALAWELGDLDAAARTISKLVVDQSVSRHVKDKAHYLKELILEERKKEAEAQNEGKTE